MDGIFVRIVEYSDKHTSHFERPRLFALFTWHIRTNKGYGVWWLYMAEHVMSDRELEKLFKAVANRRRTAILRYLRSGSATVGEIAKAIKLSIKATSRHLQILSGAGYIISEQRGLYVHYSLHGRPEIFRSLKSVLF